MTKNDYVSQLQHDAAKASRIARAEYERAKSQDDFERAARAQRVSRRYGVAARLHLGLDGES